MKRYEEIKTNRSHPLFLKSISFKDGILHEAGTEPATIATACFLTWKKYSGTSGTMSCSGTFWQGFAQQKVSLPEGKLKALPKCFFWMWGVTQGFHQMGDMDDIVAG